VEIDHVIIAVDDLDAGAKLLEDRFGLGSVPGGRHPQWGTANRIVPLGSAYLELVAVDDPDQAARTTFGRWVGSRGAAKARLIGWAVRTDRIDAVAGKLGLAITDGSRTRPDGQLLRWRTAGVDEAAAEPSLPFLIEWGAGTAHPGAASTPHRHGRVEIAAVELVGDAARLAARLDAQPLPITIRSGVPAIATVTLSSAGGVCTLGPSTLGAA
jgi:hypothetical protein